jgi:hypothetical protein
VIRQPKPMLSKVNEDENIFSCLALFVLRGFVRSKIAWFFTQVMLAVVRY